MANSKDSDSESEYEEEEATVLVNLKGIIDSDLLSQPFERFKMIGIETDQPILQLNNCFFSGEYDEMVGTGLFFQEDGRKYKKTDPIFCNDPTTRLKYVTNTTKILNMKRMFISENKDDLSKDCLDEQIVADDSSDKTELKPTTKILNMKQTLISESKE